MTAVELTVVRGHPSDHDLAAVVAVLSARASVGTEVAGQPEPSQWADRSLFLRRPLPHGPGGWRASARRR
ncbi:MAG: acyl-CoA carboxylase subunit epsilon [Actinomycetota bacterium]|nr:acyl-CoA carboxylase subunit epsilon [Actinomycetota bacterium]